MTDLDGITLTGAWSGLRHGSFSAIELFRATLARLEDTEPAVRAWAEVDLDGAVSQAVVADRRFRASPTPPPLLGIPIGIKDIFDVAGKSTRCNSRLRDDVPVAPRDSEPVHRLRKTGAVFLGKTVTQEFAAGVVSDPARNPWNPERVPGGSSGGSAVAVAVGSAVAALGSDTGGSIRIPASVTGTVGLKPTWGRIPTTGVFPLSPSLDTVGPITKTVADAAVMHLVLSNRAADVEATIRELEQAASAPSLNGIRIGVARGYFLERLQPGVLNAFESALRQMRDLGADLIDVDWADAGAASAAAMLISRVESANVHRQAIRECPELYRDDVRDRFEVGALLSGDTYLQARRARVAVRDSIAATFRQHRLDAIVAPTTPATAPPADTLEARYPDGTIEGVGPALTRLTMPWNATGQPVISVPCGFDEESMPVGLSFAGRPDDELELCHIAQAYERAAGWFSRRPAM